MQEYDFIPAVGKSNKEFWTEANTLAEEQDADMVLTYMAVSYTHLPRSYALAPDLSTRVLSH